MITDLIRSVLHFPWIMQERVIFAEAFRTEYINISCWRKIMKNEDRWNLYSSVCVTVKPYVCEGDRSSAIRELVSFSVWGGSNVPANWRSRTRVSSFLLLPHSNQPVVDLPPDSSGDQLISCSFTQYLTGEINDYLNGEQPSTAIVLLSNTIVLYMMQSGCRRVTCELKLPLPDSFQPVACSWAD